MRWSAVFETLCREGWNGKELCNAPNIFTVTASAPKLQIHVNRLMRLPPEQGIRFPFPITKHSSIPDQARCPSQS